MTKGMLLCTYDALQDLIELGAIWKWILQHTFELRSVAAATSVCFYREDMYVPPSPTPDDLVLRG